MNTDPASDIRALACGMRVFASGITLISAYVNIRLAFQTGWFRQFFIDALPGKKLPFLTEFVIQAYAFWIVISFLLLIACILITVFVRNDKRALIGLTVVWVLIFIQSHITFSAFSDPIWMLVTGMGENR